MSQPGTKASRHCWGCLEKRLVCDFALPHCKKCQKKGVVCPGYGPQKPVRWLQRNQISSKTGPPPDKAGSLSRIRTPGMNEEQFQKEWTDDLAAYTADPSIDYKRSTQVYQSNELVVQLSDRKRLKVILSKGLVEEARGMFQGEPDADPLKCLARMMRLMDLEDLPSYNLQSETCEVVQAVQYFNACMLPLAQASNELAPNPHLIEFPVAALHVLPPAVHHSLVCMSMGHHLAKLPPGTDREIVSAHWSKTYHHRGAALREVAQQVSKKKTESSDGTIMSVFMLMTTEMQQADSSGWRAHAMALKKMFDLRGGIPHVYNTIKYLRPTIISLVHLVSLANSSCPASDFIALVLDLEQLITVVNTMYDEMFPHCLCPPALFVETLRINHLRHEIHLAAQVHASSSLDSIFTPSSDHQATASAILARVQAFSPEDWAQPGVHHANWLAMAHIHKSTVLCYLLISCSACLPDRIPISEPAASPEHVTPPSPSTSSPKSPSLAKSSTRTASIDTFLDDQTSNLLSYLFLSITSPLLERFLYFALAVAGVAVGASRRGEGAKAEVLRVCETLGQRVGTMHSRRVGNALESYWKRIEMMFAKEEGEENRDKGGERSGRGLLVDWEDCFTDGNRCLL